MKYLLHHPKTIQVLQRHPGPTEWKLGSVFFTDRMGSTQRSWRAVLASILDQLISEVPPLRESVATFCPTKETHQDEDETTEYEWDIRSLRKALVFCKQQLIVAFRILFFIDAVDESDQQEWTRRDMIEFLVQLTTPSPVRGLGLIKICAASRPENDISELLSPYKGFKMQEWTEGDIDLYVRDKLNDHPHFKSLIRFFDDAEKEIRSFSRTIATKAQGVFLWVRLLVEGLRDALTNGLVLDWTELLEKVEEAPAELYGFYELMLKKIPAKSSKETRVILDCVLEAQEALSLFDIWLILESWKRAQRQGSSLERPELSRSQIHSTLASGSALKRRLNYLSGGLLEVKQPKTKGIGTDTVLEPASYKCTMDESYVFSCTVQVLHQTVRDYLKDKSAQRIFPEGKDYQTTSAIEEHNSDMIFLRAHLFWTHVRKQQQEPQSPRERWPLSEVYTTRNLETHIRRADSLRVPAYICIVDEIDRLETEKLGETWHNFPRTDMVYANRLDLKRNFVGFAIMNNLQYYVDQTLPENSALLNSLQRPSLLHLMTRASLRESVEWAESSSSMVEILLQKGADVEGSLHLQQALHGFRKKCQPYIRKIVPLLLDYGADPNGIMRSTKDPFIYQPLKDRTCTLSTNLSLIKSLVKAGADLTATDARGKSFVEVALKKDFDPGMHEWIWLFDHGLQISETDIQRIRNDRYCSNSLRSALNRSSARAREQQTGRKRSIGLDSEVRICT